MVQADFPTSMCKRETGSSRVHFVTIGDEHALQRIDNFLLTRLKGVPRSRIYRMLRRGEVRVNSQRAKARYRLALGDEIRIPPVRVAVASDVKRPLPALQARLERAVLFEDDALMVVDKPSGMPVHGGTGVAGGLIETFRIIRPAVRFLELVHRLDRQTSGCLLLAKKRSALRALHTLFREDAVSKVYLALLAGRWSGRRQGVDAPLRKNIRKSGERMVLVAKDGKPASTEFRLVRRFSHATLVEARPRTGRTHQIRVHAAHLGYPIVGDEKYGQPETNQWFRREGLKRLFLHAAELRFVHPGSGQPMVVRAPLESRLEQFLESLV